MNTSPCIESLNTIRILELEKRMQLQTEAANVAVKLASNDLRARLDSMNEFRSALKDQASNFITRKEVELKFEHMNENRRDKTSFWLSLTAIIISFFFGLISIFIKLYK